MEKENTKELLPCPFCGDEFPGVQFVKWGNFYQIYCAGCDTYFRLGAGAKQEIRERLVSAWNRRKSN